MLQRILDPVILLRASEEDSMDLKPGISVRTQEKNLRISVITYRYPLNMPIKDP